MEAPAAAEGPASHHVPFMKKNLHNKSQVCALYCYPKIPLTQSPVHPLILFLSSFLYLPFLLLHTDQHLIWQWQSITLPYRYLPLSLSALEQLKPCLCIFNVRRRLYFPIGTPIDFMGHNGAARDRINIYGLRVENFQGTVQKPRPFRAPTINKSQVDIPGDHYEVSPTDDGRSNEWQESINLIRRTSITAAVYSSAPQSSCQNVRSGSIFLLSPDSPQILD